jgi:G:T/U-mismatch repair DNA glycosylase
MKTETESHPDWYHDIPVMDVLILGNFPPHRKRWDYEFFYPNKMNNFWKVLSALAGEPLKEMKGLPAVRERKKIMEKLNAGVFNIAKSVKRKGHSARDTDIEIVEYTDLLSVIRKHPELKKIILAGFAAPSSTARQFMNYLHLMGISFTRPDKLAPGASFSIQIDKRKIKCIILNSTSTAFPIKLEKLIEQYAPYFRKAVSSVKKRNPRIIH